MGHYDTEGSSLESVNRATLLEELRGIGRAAGRAIMAVYATNVAVERKQDTSPPTAADHAAQEVIAAGLEALGDPLDGTQEFIKRNGEFTVNMALIDSHRPVLGLAYAPVRDLEYSAAAELGAWRRSGGPTARIHLTDGRADLYPRFGPTREWDTTAAQAVLESAGGCIMDLAGRPLRYHTNDDLTNPDFLAFGGRGRDWFI